MLTLVFKHHSNARSMQPEQKNWHLGKFQMPNQIIAWQLDVVLGLTCAALVRMARHSSGLLFFQVPIDGGVDLVRIVLHAGLISWYTLVINQVTKESSSINSIACFVFWSSSAGVWIIFENKSQHFLRFPMTCLITLNKGHNKWKV